MDQGQKIENSFLRKLPSEIRERVLSQCERVHIEPLQVLHKNGEEQTYVYFPEDSILSLVIQMPDERSIEVATVGKEGVMGLPYFGGPICCPSSRSARSPAMPKSYPPKPFES